MERMNYCIAVQSWMAAGDVARVEQHNAKAADLEQAKAAHTSRLAELRTGDPLAMDIDALASARGDLRTERLKLLKQEADLARRCAELCRELVPLAVKQGEDKATEADKLLAKTVVAIAKAKGLPAERETHAQNALEFEARNTGAVRELTAASNDAHNAADSLRRHARQCDDGIPELRRQASSIVLGELQGIS